MLTLSSKPLIDAVQSYIHFTYMCLSYLYSELYHAQRWNDDPLYQAYMIIHNGDHVFTQDFVVYDHVGGHTLCRMEKFYIDVCRAPYMQLFM